MDSNKTIIADGLLGIDREALMVCLACEGDVYYLALSEGKGRRLLYELLSANSKCNVIEVDASELEDLLKSGECGETHIFCKKRRWKVALGVAVAVSIFLYGIALGNAISKD